jgi:hypothetical protein
VDVAESEWSQDGSRGRRSRTAPVRPRHVDVAESEWSQDGARGRQSRTAPVRPRHVDVATRGPARRPNAPRAEPYCAVKRQLITASPAAEVRRKVSSEVWLVSTGSPVGAARGKRTAYVRAKSVMYG